MVDMMDGLVRLGGKLTMLSPGILHLCAIHPSHQIATISEESVIVLWMLRIPPSNIVSLLHGII